MRILIIEDDLSICRLLKENIQGTGTDVCCMVFASEALDCFMEHEYCLVIIDFQVSGMDGQEMLHIMRAAKHTPILVLTDPLPSDDKAALLRAGAVRNINQMISSALNCAVEQRLIPSNPTKGCVLPKLERKEMKILLPESLGTFFEEARRSGVFELYYIDLATGLRRGELLGLKWSDIDLDKGIIHVRRQILRQNGEVVEAPLKTKNSYRSITIGADAIKVLKGMEQRDEYVFPSPYGGPMSPDSVLHMLQRVLKRAGLDRIRFHDLRHTFSVLALQNGVDVKTLSAMLGHYSAGFTLDTYAHVTTSMQKQAANTVGNFLSDTLQP